MAALGWGADVPYIRHPGLDPGPAFLLLNVEKDKAGPGQARGDEEHDGGRFRSLADTPTKKGGPVGTALVSFALAKKRQAALGSAAFACAMIAVNTPPSFIARSAMTLRSRSMPASFTPCMNCE